MTPGLSGFEARIGKGLACVRFSFDSTPALRADLTRFTAPFGRNLTLLRASVCQAHCYAPYFISAEAEIRISYVGVARWAGIGLPHGKNG